MKTAVTDLSELHSLQQAAYAGKQRNPEEQAQQSEAIRPDSIRKEMFAPADGSERLDSYALPLASLRDRDRAALAEWFQRSDILEIETDIAEALLRLLPDPPWEENPFEFLKEFL